MTISPLTQKLLDEQTQLGLNSLTTKALENAATELTHSGLGGQHLRRAIGRWGAQLRKFPDNFLDLNSEALTNHLIVLGSMMREERDKRTQQHRSHRKMTAEEAARNPNSTPIPDIGTDTRAFLKQLTEAQYVQRLIKSQPPIAIDTETAIKLLKEANLSEEDLKQLINKGRFRTFDCGTLQTSWSPSLPDYHQMQFSADRTYTLQGSEFEHALTEAYPPRAGKWTFTLRADDLRPVVVAVRSDQYRLYLRPEEFIRGKKILGGSLPPATPQQRTALQNLQAQIKIITAQVKQLSSDTTSILNTQRNEL